MGENWELLLDVMKDHSRLNNGLQISLHSPAPWTLRVLFHMELADVINLRAWRESGGAR